MSDETVALVREASAKLQEAFDKSECPWCARNLEKMAHATGDLADVMVYTDETAARVRAMKVEGATDEVIDKVSVLKRVVDDRLKKEDREAQEAQNDRSRQSFIRSERPLRPGGISLALSENKQIVVGSVGVGTIGAFAANRLGEYIDGTVRKGVVQPYTQAAPIVKMVAGAGVAAMGAYKKVIPSQYSTMAVSAGATLIENALAEYVEMAYSQMMTPASNSGAQARIASRMPARMPAAPGYVQVQSQPRGY